MKIEEVYGQNYTFVDVRSPKEFVEDHIPEAINIPLFDNDERAMVGTLYTKTSREAAIDKGMQIFSAKLPDMYQKFKILPQPIIIYCWRGGMRSRAIVALLKSIGMQVYQLERGYKEYRRFVRESLSTIQIPKLIALYGLTGTGKTQLLKQLENKLDLEGLAQHRGSVFGDINLKPRTQKMFESKLLKELHNKQNHPYLFIEGESRKIGKVMIPENVWQAMQKAIKVKVISTITKRVEHTYQEYSKEFNKDIFIEKVLQIKKHIGTKKVNELIELFNQNKIKEAFKILLKDYYDPLYSHTVDSKKYLATVSNIAELKQLEKELLIPMKKTT